MEAKLSEKEKNTVLFYNSKKLVNIDTIIEYSGNCLFKKYEVVVDQKYNNIILPDVKDIYGNSNFYRVKIADLEVGVIKGIIQNSENSAIVEYTKVIKGKKSDFSIIYDNDESIVNTSEIFRISFVKYDDGWRIQKI